MKKRVKISKLLAKMFIVSLSLVCSLCFISCSNNSNNEENNENVENEMTEDKENEKEINSGIPIDLYLIGGQSNAGGATNHQNMLKGVFRNVGYAGQVNNQYRTGVSSADNISSFDKYYWEVKAGYGELTSRVGPEYGMAKALNDLYSKSHRAFIMKSAAGATAVVVNNNSAFGTWLPRSMWDEGYIPSPSSDGIGWQYYKFVENFRSVYSELKSHGYAPVVKGLAWYQGASDLGAHRQYGEALTNLIKDLREDLFEITGDESLKEMTVVIGKIPTTFSQYNNKLVPPFNVVQQEVADYFNNCETIEVEDLLLVNPDGTINGSDQYHYNFKDMETLGMRLAEKILEINEKRNN